LKRIRAQDRGLYWRRYISRILGPNGTESAAMLEGEFGENKDERAGFARLSSGQAILCHFVTALLAWIQRDSLILFDEPETHLHPNAVASLFLVLSEILTEYESFAVVATHSPVVIQEIPAKR